VKEVRKGASNPLVIISRSDPKFLTKLFEIEIPEIYDGIIEIKGVAREAGERSKVSVESHDDRIDAVGACVGMKGVRIHAIVRELNNENIDVINYSSKPDVYIQRALAPAKLKSIQIDGEAKTATVTVEKDQVSLAIGRNGQNVRLASKLTGYEINLIKEGVEEEYDMDLEEFREELGEPLYERLIDEGFKTARDIIEAEPEELLIVDGLDEKKISSLKEMMQRELEEADVEEEAIDEGVTKEAIEHKAEKTSAKLENEPSVNDGTEES
jgi:N utilization substance protein A